MRGCRVTSGTRALIDVEVLTEQALVFLWLSRGLEGVGADLESGGNNRGRLGGGAALTLSIGEDNREVWQEYGSSEEHPHHPTLNKHGKDDANHANDLRDQIFGHAVATFFIGGLTHRSDALRLAQLEPFLNS
jgi:hypothetical protein